jgi:alpha-1,6-mannosyltransferase
MMHIVQVANFITPTSGGQRLALNSLAHEYIKRGNRCTLVFPGKTKSEWSDGERKCVQVPGLSVPLSGGYRAIIKRKELQRVLIELQPDVVELSDKTTLSWLPEWCRQNKIPCVLFSHERASDVVSERLPKLLPVKRVFRKWAQNIEDHTDAIVCASNYAAQEYSRISHKVHIVRLGVDHMVFRGSAGQAPDISSPVVLFAGRLSVEKRPYLVIEAARHLQLQGHNISFLIAGDGPMKSSLAASADGLDVKFLGRISDRAELAEIMASATATIAPSPFETFGLSILESLACGTPVVTARTGAGPELVENDCGEAVASDGAAIAQALLRIFSQDQNRLRMRCASRAASYSWYSSAATMLWLYSSLRNKSLRAAA